MASSGIIRLPNAPDSSTLHCCCGRSDCALLKRNSSVLETVEKDVHTAAQLGQVSTRFVPHFSAFLRPRLDVVVLE
jgi:hypothetical protein